MQICKNKALSNKNILTTKKKGIMTKSKKNKKMLIMLAASFITLSSCGLSAAEQFSKCNKLNEGQKSTYSRIVKTFAQIKKHAPTLGEKWRKNSNLVPEVGRYAITNPNFVYEVMNAVNNEVGDECYADFEAAVDAYIKQSLPDVSLKEYLELFKAINSELLALPEYQMYNCEKKGQKGYFDFCNGKKSKTKEDL